MCIFALRWCCEKYRSSPDLIDRRSELFLNFHVDNRGEQTLRFCEYREFTVYLDQFYGYGRG